MDAGVRQRLVANNESTEHMDQIEAAAKMAGEWWAERLSSQHADKRAAFAAAVAKHCQSVLRDRGICWLAVDYDPQGPMLDAVRDAVDPSCRGMMFSARGILPDKHGLDVTPTKLRPKEGYGNWTAELQVPAAGAA